ncbi:hypothetical protein [Streptomyces sp. NBC_00285]|uniref:hypothetical protein n=1 Tax=Streptomyces sp. NBC_00285 TaxID=2975700 RepID=UPI002E2E6886|nr:hypothetical protein [Streptomyces sp. NBC_00285]
MRQHHVGRREAVFLLHEVRGRRTTDVDGDPPAVPAVREIMRSLDSRDGPDVTRRILRERLDRIAARSVALLRAGTDPVAVVDATRAPPGPPA